MKSEPLGALARSAFVASSKFAALGLSLALAGSVAQASLIWSGDASKGTGVFKNLNIQAADDSWVGNPSPNGSSVTAITDSTHGKVWKFDKAVNDRRCEAHGAAGFTPAQGHTYFIGWESKISSTADNNAVFQWKSYGSPMVQNFPLVLKMIGGKLNLMYTAPGGSSHIIWSKTISANSWHKYVLEIKVSASTTGGAVSFWFDGTQQSLSGQTSYVGKTFDGDAVDPKWGIYGANSVHENNTVDSLKIGTTYADVAP